MELALLYYGPGSSLPEGMEETCKQAGVRLLRFPLSDEELLPRNLKVVGLIIGRGAIWGTDFLTYCEPSPDTEGEMGHNLWGRIPIIIAVNPPSPANSPPTRVYTPLIYAPELQDEEAEKIIGAAQIVSSIELMPGVHSFEDLCAQIADELVHATT